MKTFRRKTTLVAAAMVISGLSFATLAATSVTLGIPNHKDGGSFNDKKNSSYEVKLVNQSGNTWNYKVTTKKGFALSHWVLGIPECDGHYQSKTGGAEVGKDGSIKAESVVGIKWNFEGDFTIILDDNYPKASVPALVKANNGYGKGMIDGPDCSGGTSQPKENLPPAEEPKTEALKAPEENTSSSAADVTATYCVSRFTTGDSQHVIGSMSGFAKDFVFTEPKGGKFVEYSDGTAHFYGLVKEVTKSGNDIHNGLNQLFVDVKLDGLTNIPPEKPKAKCNKDKKNKICRYYPTVTSGSLTGQEAFEGGEMTITRRGPAFQAGQGANAKNGNYGVSMWYHYKTTSQPVTGEKIFPSTGQGDFNLELHQLEQCPQDKEIKEEPPEEVVVEEPEEIVEEPEIIEEPEEETSPDDNSDTAADVTATYCVSKFTGGSSQHVIGSMSGFAADFIFTEDKGGRFVEYSDGTAHFYGMAKEVDADAKNISGGNNQLYIDVKLDGLTNIPPEKPKAKCDKDTDNKICRYYPTVTSGSLTGHGDFDGGVMTITRRGPAFQAGQGANAKNGNYGASMWYSYQTTSQPITGKKTFPSTGRGDFNLELHTLDKCPQEVIEEEHEEVKPTEREWATDWDGSFYFYKEKIPRDAGGDDLCTLTGKGDVSELWEPQWITVKGYIQLYRNGLPGKLQAKLSTGWYVVNPKDTNTPNICPDEAPDCVGSSHNIRDEKNSGTVTSDQNGRVEFETIGWWPGVTPEYAAMRQAKDEEGKTDWTLMQKYPVENHYGANVYGSSGPLGRADREDGKNYGLGKDLFWYPWMISDDCPYEGPTEEIPPPKDPPEDNISDKEPPGNPNITCPSDMGLAAKYEWSGSDYAYEKPEGNENLVNLIGDAANGDWTSKITISHVLLKGATGTYTYEVDDTTGSFSKNDLPLNGGGKHPDISNIQFCADPNTPPPPDDEEKPDPACKNIIYAVHDGDLNNSQLLTIDPDNGYAVAPLGPEYPKYDLEGLDISPVTLELFAASGDDPKGYPAGHLYKVNRSNGELTSVGTVNFDYQGQTVSGREISALSFSPDGELWGWAEECGLIKINKEDASAELIVEHVDASRVCLDPDPSKYTSHVEDLSWDNTGSVIYAAETNSLWKYNYATGDLDLVTSLPKGVRAIEIMEMMPDGNILIGQQNRTGSTSLGLESLNPESAQIEAGVNIPTGDYYDIEGVAWPTCSSNMIITDDEPKDDDIVVTPTSFSVALMSDSSTDVANVQDDAWDGNYNKSTTSTTWIGGDSNDTLGLRFASGQMAIESGMTVQSATLLLTNGRKDNNWNKFQVLIFAEKSNAPAQFSSNALPSDRDLTNSSSGFTFDNKWLKDATLEIDVTAPVKELVDSGNLGSTLALILQGQGGSTFARQFFYSNGAVLNVELVPVN